MKRVKPSGVLAETLCMLDFECVGLRYASALAKLAKCSPSAMCNRLARLEAMRWAQSEWIRGRKIFTARR